MFLGHTATWWALALAIFTTLLSLPPGNLLVKALTLTIQKWIAERGKRSLVKRIGKLETELASLEAITPITETENHILWGITSVRILLMGMTNIIIGVVYFAISTTADQHSEGYKAFTGCVIGFFIMNGYSMLRERYRSDYRHTHHPRRKAALIKSIEDLKHIRDTWGS